jgi:hypothetical protein
VDEPSKPVLLCPPRHANWQHAPPKVIIRSPARKGPSLSLSKTWNVAKLRSKISSSWRTISRLSPALSVIVSSDGAGLARDAPLASVNDNPAAPNTGTALLPRFRLDVCFARDIVELSRAYPRSRIELSSRALVPIFFGLTLGR